MIKLNNVSLHYGGQDILKNAEMLIRDNDRIGLVGPNGAGKSSLFKLLVKELSPSSGEIITDRKNARIGYFSQNVGEMSGRTVLEEVIAGAGRVSEIATRLEELEAKMGGIENALNQIVGMLSASENSKPSKKSKEE